MKRMNLGCGPDILEGWVNTDKIQFRQGMEWWDATHKVVPKKYINQFDFVLINHVLCTMNPSDVAKVLENVKTVLKDGGKIQVIDMNLLKAIRAYEDRDQSAIPAEGKSIEEKLCNHISGYGTRLSLFTPKTLAQLLINHGFKDLVALGESEYDLRPKESVIMEATK